MSLQPHDMPADRFIPEALEDRLVSFSSRLTGLVVLAAIAASWASLLSWSAADPSLTNATSLPVRNLLGYPGAVVADLMLQTFGLACIVVLLVPTIWGLELAMGRQVLNLRSKLTYFPTSVLVLAGAFSALPLAAAGGAPWPLHHGFGGIMGDAVYRLSVNLMSFAIPDQAAWASGLFLFAAGFAAVAVSIGRELRDLKGDQRSVHRHGGWFRSGATARRPLRAAPREAQGSLDARRSRQTWWAGAERVEPDFGAATVGSDARQAEPVRGVRQPQPAPHAEPRGRANPHASRRSETWDVAGQPRPSASFPGAGPFEGRGAGWGDGGVEERPRDETTSQHGSPCDTFLDGPGGAQAPALNRARGAVTASAPGERASGRSFESGHAGPERAWTARNSGQPATSNIRTAQASEWSADDADGDPGPLLQRVKRDPTPAANDWSAVAEVNRYPSQSRSAPTDVNNLPQAGPSQPNHGVSLSDDGRPPDLDPSAPLLTRGRETLAPRFRSLRSSLEQHARTDGTAFQAVKAAWARRPHVSEAPAERDVSPLDDGEDLPRVLKSARRSVSPDVSDRGRQRDDRDLDRGSHFDVSTEAESKRIAERFAPGGAAQTAIVDDGRDPQDALAPDSDTDAPVLDQSTASARDGSGVSQADDGSVGFDAVGDDAVDADAVGACWPNVPLDETSEEAARSARSDRRPAGYAPPSLTLLESGHETAAAQARAVDDLAERAALLQDVLADYGVKGEVRGIQPGPVVTLYEFEPARGIKTSRVIGLADDIARSMSALSARVAVIPGRNLIGIELPNGERQTVYLRDILETEAYRAADAGLPIVLGQGIGGEPVVDDLARMPHLLVAGTTGSGKSVGVNAIILSLLYRFQPDQCRFLMIDPKMLELSVYNNIPHLLAPVVTDPEQAVSALNWVVAEMEERYKQMAQMSVRTIDVFNNRVRHAKKRGETIARMVQTGFDKRTGQPIFEQSHLDVDVLPRIVVVIDEFADLMMVAGKDVEAAVQRIAQKARAAGIHLIMATQRPSVDVITGTIKANFPTRVSFKVASKIDSRTILNEPGAEQLLGRGDMLFSAGGGALVRVHGPFVADEEVEAVADVLRTQGPPEYVDISVPDDLLDPPVGDQAKRTLFDDAVALVVKDQRASISYLQRRLGIGYNRAATLMDRMEADGIVSPADRGGKRQVLLVDLGDGRRVEPPLVSAAPAVTRDHRLAATDAGRVQSGEAAADEAPSLKPANDDQAA